MTVEQLAARGPGQDTLLLIALRALGIETVKAHLEPRDAQPQAGQPEKQTGRSHQHPTPAHVRVGQLLPSVERRVTQTARPSLAPCGGAAGPTDPDATSRPTNHVAGVPVPGPGRGVPPPAAR